MFFRSVIYYTVFAAPVELQGKSKTLNFYIMKKKNNNSK